MGSRWITRLRALTKLSTSWTNYEDLRPGHDQALTWMQPEGNARALLLTQKEPVFRRIAPGLAERSVATCLVPYPIPSAKACHAIERLARALQTPLFWFGDLDPIGLTAFGIVRSARGARANSVSYVGIDARWLSIVEREARRQARPLQQHILTMGREERQHFDRIVDLARDIPLGERCFTLLASGKKLEVEGLMTVSPTLLRRTPSLLARRIETTGSTPPVEQLT